MWSRVLVEPIRLDNGEVLRTLNDVRLFLTSIPRDLARHDKWRDLAFVLAEAAMSGTPEMVDTVTALIKLAIETPPYAPVRLVAEEKPVYVKRRGAGRLRKRLLH